MKKISLISLFICVVLTMSGQQQDMSHFFKQMPDSLMPYLTTNNRLDMIDFREAGMKAEVCNLLDGQSEMTYLSEDSLCIRMSDALQVEMKLMPGDSLVICVLKTYIHEKSQKEKVMSHYSPDWQLINSYIELSSLLKRDEELFNNKEN